MQIKRFQSPLLPESRNLLALCFMLLAGFNLLIFFMVSFMAFRINDLAARKTTFAQLVNGETLYISEQERYWRYPGVIQNLVKDWMELTFNWDGQIPGTNEPDQGYEVQEGKITSSAYFASLLLEPKFGQATLAELAKLTDRQVFTGDLRATVLISHVSEPRMQRQGEWEVDVVATRLLVQRDSGREERIPYNRTFRLQAVEVQTPPLGPQANLFERRVYQLRAAGLEITQIVPYYPHLQ